MKVGTLAKVVANESNHKFRNGDKVIIVEDCYNDTYYAKNPKTLESWYVEYDDVESVKEYPTIKLNDDFEGVFLKRKGLLTSEGLLSLRDIQKLRTAVKKDRQYPTILGYSTNSYGDTVRIGCQRFRTSKFEEIDQLRKES